MLIWMGGKKEMKLHLMHRKLPIPLDVNILCVLHGRAGENSDIDGPLSDSGQEIDPTRDSKTKQNKMFVVVMGLLRLANEENMPQITSSGLSRWNQNTTSEAAPIVSYFVHWHIQQKLLRSRRAQYLSWIFVSWDCIVYLTMFELFLNYWFWFQMFFNTSR